MKNQAHAYAQAVSQFRVWAAQGNPEAMYKLGQFYETGQAVPKNMAEAARWYRKAAGKGELSAMARLGVLHGNGYGVLKDRIEALFWFLSARKLGAGGLDKTVEKLRSLMNAEEIALAEGRAENWKPEKA
ncbi:MAG: sel1 repeat family protein [Deltaproteobacteria bacterium]|nr:sel1 repeat family protein [Deltaproteobacteria bacterium]